MVLGSACSFLWKTGLLRLCLSAARFRPEVLDHSVLIQNDLNQLLAAE
jgi:hypothetical protein